jgi:predicted small lipoprotein YifL
MRLVMVVVSFAVLSALSACGQKGALYLPTKAPTKAPTSAATTTTDTTAPSTTTNKPAAAPVKP